MDPVQKSNGALIGSIIIIVILLVGGIYLWKNSHQETPLSPASNVGTSSDTASMEADVNNIDVDGVDNGI